MRRSVRFPTSERPLPTKAWSIWACIVAETLPPEMQRAHGVHMVWILWRYAPPKPDRAVPICRAAEIQILSKIRIEA